MKKKYWETYLKIAETVANQHSSAVRAQVGCVLVQPKSNASFISYNGTLPGQSNVCEYKDEKGNLVTKDELIHAEMNGIMQVAKSNESTVGMYAFVTHSPCVNCAKHLAAAGVAKVIYRKVYKNDDGVRLLNDYGIETVLLGENDAAI